jgi:phosphotransferase system enzyme I (PtsP)
MLHILRRIVQEINTASYFGEALQVLVERVREAVSTQACSVFLIDNVHKEYVLLATDGLNANSVGKIRLKLHEGLVGLVGQREELINLEDAPSHPNFVYFREIGEERYKAFLGVPIIHHRRLLGVLIIQQEEQRRFDDTEEAFMVTISAQLGAVIAHAEATGAIAGLLTQRNTHEIQQDTILRGIPSSPGIGKGIAAIVYPSADLNAVPDRKIKHTSDEIAAFKRAISQTKAEIKALSLRLNSTLLADEKTLFDAYLRILDSTTLSAEITEEIQKGNWAQGALRKVITSHIRQFEAMENDYLRERATDLRDLGRRVLLHLQAGQRTHVTYSAETILVGEEISASDLVEIPHEQLMGVVSLQGSHNSHVAILARALGIPAVMGVEGLPLNQLENIKIIIDGYQGHVYLAPSKKLRRNFTNLILQQKELTASLEELRDLPAQTLDNHSISLWVNTGLAADAGLSLTAGAEGVGLYRTEVPFMNRDSFPAEEEQYVIYRQLLNAFAPRPVIMRTLDIGGDKGLPYFPVEENNPFLGWRGIRLTLDHPEIFLMQLRAMIRANKDLNNLRIMLPMVTCVAEADDALRLIQQAYQEVSAKYPQTQLPPIGVMIEVPSAVYEAKALAKRVDFFSVGSNDLTQYLLAVDRNNTRVAGLYDALHPAVLHALTHIVEIAHAAHKPVSICGEMASDPLTIPLLLAMGFDALSMNSAALPRVKWVIRNFTLQRAKILLKDVLAYENASLIRQALETSLREVGLEKLIGKRKTSCQA